MVNHCEKKSGNKQAHLKSMVLMAALVIMMYVPSAIRQLLLGGKVLLVKLLLRPMGVGQLTQLSTLKFIKKMKLI